MAGDMARRVAADMVAMVLLAAGDLVVAAITLARRRRGKQLGEDKI